MSIKRRNENLEEYRLRERMYAQKYRKPNFTEHTPKPDTIVAIGYAERQMAATLANVEPIRTEL